MNSMPQSYRPTRIVIDPDTLAARRERMTPGLRMAIVALVTVVAMGGLEWLHRGTVASILTMLKIVALALWSMLCSIVGACREFLKFVDGVRS